jgi:hypothetical protein
MRVKRRPVPIHQRRSKLRLRQTTIPCTHTPVSLAPRTPTRRTHYCDPRCQIAPTAPRDRSHLAAAPASAAASLSAQSAGAHGTLAVGARGRSLLAAATRRRTARRAAAGSRTARMRPGMRRAAAAARSWLGAARTGRPGGSPGAGWGGRCAARASRAGACCSRGARRRCAAGVARTRGGLGTAFARPVKCQSHYRCSLELRYRPARARRA